MADKIHTEKAEDAQREVKRILDRVERESETIATSTMARSSDQFGKNAKGQTDGNLDEDPIELLGKRIGRGLGWVAMICLVIYLISTYMIK